MASSTNVKEKPANQQTHQQQLPDHLKSYNYVLETDELPLESHCYPPEIDLIEAVKQGTYPTLHWLARRQIEFGRSPKESTLPGAPLPSRRRKSDLFNLADFVEIDRRARSQLPSARQSWESFGEQLFSGCRDELDKLRAAFCFVGTADPAKISKNSAGALKGGPMDIVAKMRDHSMQSDVFERLLVAGSIPYKRLRGFKKGIEFKLGHACRSTGIWFACWMRGEWRLVDAHWGSTAVVNFSDGNYRRIDESSGEVADAKANSGSKLYKCNEEYFLTDADVFVQDHLPLESAEWQLLVRPVTAIEFYQMPKVNIEFERNFNLEVVDCPRNVVLVPANGLAALTFREAGPDTREYSVELFVHTASFNAAAAAAIKQAVQDPSLERLTRVSRSGKDLTVSCTPPAKGKYQLLIKGRCEQIAPGGMEVRVTVYPLYMYVLHCASPNPRRLPEAVDPRQLSEFGAGRRAAEAGVESDSPGELLAGDGEATLRLRHPNSTKPLRAAVRGVEDETDASGKLLAWRQEAGDGSTFHFLAKEAGQYALVIYGDADWPLCQFLIDADVECLDAPTILPASALKLGRVVGSTNGGDKRLQRLQPVTHPEPYIRTEEFELKTVWRVDQGAEAENKIFKGFSCDLLMLDVADGKEVGGGDRILDGLTFVQPENGDDSKDDSQQIAFIARFPKPGNYMLRLTARLTSLDDETDNGKAEEKCFFNYLVRAVGVSRTVAAEQFPFVGPSWWLTDSCRLLTPQQLLLRADAPTVVQLAVAESAVAMATERLKLRLPNGELIAFKGTDSKGVLEATVPAAKHAKEAGSPVTLESVEASASKPPATLLTFRYETPADLANREATRQEAETSRSRRLAEAVRRRRRQADYARQRSGLPPLTEEEAVQAEEKRQREQAEAEERKRAEAEAEETRKHEEEKRKQEEETRKQEEEKRKQEEAEVEEKRKQEEENRKQEEENRKQEEENRKQEEENRKQEEENRKQEEEKRKQEEAEAEEKRKQEEENRKQEEENRKQEEEKRKQEEENRKQEEEKRKQEEENRKHEEEKRKQEEEKRKQEEENRKQEEENRKQEEENRKQEEENRKHEEEKRKQAEAEAEEKRRQLREEAEAASKERKTRLATLKECLQRGRLDALEAAAEAVRSKGDAAEDGGANSAAGLLRQADELIIGLRLKDSLSAERKLAEGSRDVTRLESLLVEADSYLANSGGRLLPPELLKEIERCRELVKRERRLKKRLIHQLDVDSKSLLELRGYADPDQLVHQSVMAMLLLLGNYEKRVRKWKRCQPLLKDIKTLSQMDVNDIHPEIAARAELLLAGIDPRELRLRSAAAWAFYDWSTKCIASVKRLTATEADKPASDPASNGEKDEEETAAAAAAAAAWSVKPASLKRQRKLLRVSLAEDEELDWEDGVGAGAAGDRPKTALMASARRKSGAPSAGRQKSAAVKQQQQQQKPK